MPTSFAPHTTRLAALWLATGALFKLFAGSPKLLPPLIVEQTPFDLDLTFRLAVAAELALVALAMLRPRAGWPFIVLIFAFFEVILVDQASRGAESCGCLGDAVKMSPTTMMAIDGVLLALVLLSRPWKHWSGAPWFTKPSAALVGALGLLGAIAPWLVIPGSAPATSTAAGDGAAAGAPAARYEVWQPERWVGQMVYDIPELAAHVGEAGLPVDGVVVLWRQSCDHCKKHLEEMRGADKADRQIVLLQLQDDLKSSRVVEALPEGAHVSRFQTPAGVDIVLTTPWDIVVAGGVVQTATETR